jgi:hypothetical protein
MKIVIDTNQDMWELFEDITRQCLIDSYKVNEEMKEYDEYKKFHKALKVMIKYYSTPDQWKQFQKEALE